jgi:ATP-dependent Clp protease ATP-binding subunit ClpC
MTSNVGASEIAKNTGIGFTIGDETGITYEDMKTRIMGELKKVFRPEFLNRIDEVIVFHKLTKEEISSIVELLLKRIRESLAERELTMNLSESAADFLVEKGWDPSMGARCAGRSSVTSRTRSPTRCSRSPCRPARPSRSTRRRRATRTTSRSRS